MCGYLFELFYGHFKISQHFDNNMRCQPTISYNKNKIKMTHHNSKQDYCINIVYSYSTFDAFFFFLIGNTEKFLLQRQG